MALKLPTVDDLERIAAAHHFELPAAEAADYQSLIPGMFEALEVVDRKIEPPTPERFPKRDPGRRPKPDEDPLNAIVRWCCVKGASGGKLAGKRIAIKDNTCIAGILMSCGSQVLAGYTPDIDATVV